MNNLAGTVAFLGMGRMGSGMAARLLAAGYSVTVYNRNAERLFGLYSE